MGVFRSSGMEYWHTLPIVLYTSHVLLPPARAKIVVLKMEHPGSRQTCLETPGTPATCTVRSDRTHAACWPRMLATTHLLGGQRDTAACPSSSQPCHSLTFPTRHQATRPWRLASEEASAHGGKGSSPLDNRANRPSHSRSSL